MQRFKSTLFARSHLALFAVVFGIITATSFGAMALNRIDDETRPSSDQVSLEHVTMAQLDRADQIAQRGGRAGGETAIDSILVAPPAMDRADSTQRLHEHADTAVVNPAVDRAGMIERRRMGGSD